MKKLSHKDTSDLMFKLATNWVLERGKQGKLTYHDWTAQYICKALHGRFFDETFEELELVSLNENSILDVVDRVNKYVRFSDTMLTINYECYMGVQIMSSTIFVVMLSDEQQNKVKALLMQDITDAMYENPSEVLDNAMCGRVCDLQETDSYDDILEVVR